MWVENRDGGGDGDSLHFYVAITLPQMPLSEIDDVVNLFSARRAKERHQIFGACWRDSARRGAKSNFWAGRPPCLLSRDQNFGRP